MDEALVVNASPLILLARIDRLDLLASLAKLLIVPEAVIRQRAAVREVWVFPGSAPWRLSSSAGIAASKDRGMS